MPKLAKGAIFFVVGLLVLFAILQGTLPTIIDASDNLTATEDMPDIIGTIASFWWVGIVLLLIGVVMKTNWGRRTFRRYRRRR